MPVKNEKLPDIKMAAKLRNLRVFYGKKARAFARIPRIGTKCFFSGTEQNQAFAANQLSTWARLA
jgi:hypothetical protein